MIAGQLPNIYYLALGMPVQGFGREPGWWVLYTAGTLVSLVLWSAMLLRQRDIVTRQPANIRAELREGLRRLPALVALGFLAALLIAAGLFVLIVPGLYLMIGLILAWPALLFERRTPVAAIRHSLHLVRDNWWRTAAMLIVAFLVAMVFYIVVFALIAILLPLLGADDVAMLTAASVVVVIALGAVGVPFYGAILLALYGDLGTRRYGTDLASRLTAASRG
jgi:hypothetical protein